MKFHILIYSFALLTGIPLLVTCNYRLVKFDLEAGQKTYENKCAMCHSFKSHNRMYIPTMHQMMDIDSMQLAARLGHIEKDPTHASVIRFKDNFEKQQLIYFIEHYGEIKP